MKNPKPPPFLAGLLAVKGAAAPSSADRDNLGPSRVGQAAADAMTRNRRPVPGGPPAGGAAGGGQGARVNVSVRLDPDRHRRLRLASIHLGKPAQAIMVRALDAYLERIANGPPAGRTDRDAEQGP